MRKITLYSLLSFSAFMLPSCQIGTDKITPFLEENVVWSSDDGAISFSVQGNTINGFGKLRLFQFDIDTMFYYNRRENILVVDDENSARNKNIFLYFTLKGVGDNLKVIRSSNSTGDPYYDSYSCTLTKRAMLDDELDARYFDIGSFENEDGSISLCHNSVSFFSGELDSLISGKKASFRFLPERRFSITVDGADYGEGAYKSYPTGGMGLLFDGGQGSIDYPSEEILSCHRNSFSKYGSETEKW